RRRPEQKTARGVRLRRGLQLAVHPRGHRRGRQGEQRGRGRARHGQARMRRSGVREAQRLSGIPVVLFPRSKSAPEGVPTAQLLNALRDLRVDFVLLAGYLKLIPGELVQAYPRSILNIHPSLLPAFGGKGYYGLKVHKAVIASGARYSGPTVHFVDEQFDTGRTLAQRVVPVLADDTPEQLAARVLHEKIPGPVPQVLGVAEAGEVSLAIKLANMLKSQNQVLI
uniref:phosphoribosylglycinamide formyltransferase 1 n=1 Tax=Aegilops tauschii subsp. strangulata TaxID=200361 RepID=A0A453A041_AEGTS